MDHSVNPSALRALDTPLSASLPVADRREFLERLTVGAAALAAGSFAAAVPLASAHAEAFSAAWRVKPATGTGGPWSDAWLSRITGKHKQLFDSPESNEGFPLVFAMAFLNLNHEVYNLEDKDITAVVVLRHFAMPLALPDALWAKYKIGESLKIMDSATKAPATRNPFIHPDGVPFAGAEIPTLVKRGVIFTVCNVALTVVSGKLASNAGVTAAAAKDEWTSSLLPGMTLVPVGVMAVNLGQEKGCTYCYGG